MSDLHKNLANYRKAVSRLKKGIEKYDVTDELARDGLILRFEFTFELSWKVLKAVFEDEGLMGLNSPRSALREAYAANLINDEELWLTMLRDRNSTAHLYDAEIATKISEKIRLSYLSELTRLEHSLENRIS